MTCGDYGGLTTKGEPCKRTAGWGVPGTDEGRCKTHLAQEPAPPAWPVVLDAPIDHRLTVEELGQPTTRVTVDAVPVEVAPPPPPPPPVGVMFFRHQDGTLLNSMDTVAGDIYVEAVPPRAAAAVTFHVNGAQYRRESLAPFTLGGDDAAGWNAFNTRTYPDGALLLRAVAEYADGTTDEAAITVKVVNNVDEPAISLRLIFPLSVTRDADGAVELEEGESVQYNVVKWVDATPYVAVDGRWRQAAVPCETLEDIHILPGGRDGGVADVTVTSDDVEVVQVHAG
jgi:hypothetical protein